MRRGAIFVMKGSFGQLQYRRITMRIILSVLLFLFIHTGVVNARLSYEITSYTTEDGLSQRNVNGIMQTKDGYMWFLTRDGMNKFNGYSFKPYKAYPGDNCSLTTNRIVNVAEDKYGFIWTTTHDGHVFRFNPRTDHFRQITDKTFQIHVLQVFDNHVWVVTLDQGLLHMNVTPDDVDIPIDNFSTMHGISFSERINRTPIDNQSNSWVLTNNGLYLVKDDIRNPIAFFVENQNENSTTQSFYNFTESEDEILFTSNNGNVWRYNKLEKKFSLLKLPTSSEVTYVFFLSEQLLFFATSTDGFMVYNQSTGQTEHYRSTTHPALVVNEITHVYMDSHKEMWIQPNCKGIVRFHPFREELVYYPPVDEPITHSRLFLHEDVQQRMWIQPSGRPFSYYDRETKTLIPFYEKEDSQANWMLSVGLMAVCSDAQGNLWLSSNYRGLEKATFRDEMFHAHSVDGVALENDTRMIYQDRSGLIWSGTKDGRIHVYNEKKEFLGNLTRSGDVSLTKADLFLPAYCMEQDRHGTLWVGTRGDGLIAIDSIGNGKFKLNYHKNDPLDMYSLSDDNIFSMHEDSNGRMWVATYGGGVNYIDRSENGNLIFINHRNHMKNYPIKECYRTRVVESDGNGNIWVGTTNGLIAFKSDFSAPENISFHYFVRLPGDIHSLSSIDVYDIFSTVDGELYIATLGGGLNKLLSFEDGKAKFKSYTTKNGLPSDILYSIQGGESGVLWLVMEEEICRFLPETGEVENFNWKYFPFPVVFNEGKPVRLYNGEILLSTNKGFFSFNPDSIQKSHYEPRIAFSQLIVGDRTIVAGDESGILDVDIDVADRLTLSHKCNAFTIQFAALDLRYSDDIRYAYKLEGFEKNWNDVGKRATATYTNLPKGYYRLLVKSTNGDGVWIEKARVLPIEVLPSFWETPWAFCLYAFVIVGGILLAVYILFTFYRLRDKINVEKEIADIKLRFFTNVSHELRTPLTLIAAPIENILHNYNIESEVKEQLFLVERNASRMLRLVNQILDFRKIQNKKMKMQVQQIQLKSFILDVMGSFYPVADAHQIEYGMESIDEQLFVWADADKLEKILFNLLSNAFKYTPRGRQIKLIVKSDDKNVTISVKDQGVGIDKSKQKSLFVRFENLMDNNIFNQPSTGIGLSMVKELVEMHKGTIRVESALGKGSEFIVSIPRGKAHFDDDTEFILTDHVISSSVPKDLYENKVSETGGGILMNADKNTMLIVEDNVELRSFVRAIFEADFNIIEAENGEVGYNKALEYTPDIIISDVMMPVKDGVTMTKELRSNVTTSHVLIVLLTAKTNVESRIKGIELGANDYITKPFSSTYLKVRVENLIDQRRKMQKHFSESVTQRKAKSTDKGEKEFSEQMLTLHDQKFITKLTELMEQNLDNAELMVEDLALDLNMCRSVFFNKIKSLFGKSPVEFIREMRMKKAAELIESDEYSIAEISDMVGYNDPHYFSKCFKQVFSCTPTKYKEQHKRAKNVGLN